jgi:hypothetical protein
MVGVRPEKLLQHVNILTEAADKNTTRMQPRFTFGILL